MDVECLTAQYILAAGNVINSGLLFHRHVRKISKLEVN